MQRVTILDIAERCGVTPAVVSSVLNGAGRRSRCSEEKRQFILQTAEEMNYHPNIFARSMVTRQVPVVLLMLPLDPRHIAFSSRYFAESVAGASMVLNENGLETIVAIYQNEEEQVARFTDLVRKGIIGGVISDTISGCNGKFIQALFESKLPYVLQGETDTLAVSVMPGNGSSHKFYLEAQKRYGAEKIFIHQAEFGRDVLFPFYDIPDYDRFHYDPIRPTPELVSDPRNMIVSLGYEYYLRLNSSMKIASPLVHERQSFEFMIPKGVPRLISTSTANCFAEAAKILVQWQVFGKEPECKTYYILPEKPQTELKWC